MSWYTEGKTIPLKYYCNEKLDENPPTIQIKCKDAGTNEIKGKCKVYAGGPSEGLLRAIDGIYTVGERYGWDDANQNANGGKLGIQHVGQALKGPTEKWLKKLSSNMRKPTWNLFKDKAHILVEDVMQENAYKDQYEYLEETKMPKDMSISECLDQIEEINDALPLLQKDGKRMSEEDLIMKVVTKNLPQYLVKDFIMKEGKKPESYWSKLKRSITSQRRVKCQATKKRTRLAVRKRDQKRILHEINATYLGTIIPGRNVQTILGQTTSMEHISSK